MSYLLKTLNFVPVFPVGGDMSKFQPLTEEKGREFLFPQKKFSSKYPEGEDRVYLYLNSTLRGIVKSSSGEELRFKAERVINCLASLKLHDIEDLGRLVQEVHIRQFCRRIAEICLSCNLETSGSKLIAYYDEFYQFLSRRQ